MKRMILGSAAAALMAIASPVLAATPSATTTVNLGNIYGGTGYFTTTTIETPTAATYNFSMSTASVLHATVTNQLFLNSLSAIMYDSLNNQVWSSGSVPKYDSRSDQFSLAQGNYRLEIAATPKVTASHSYGTYGLELRSDLAAPPVPGPAGLLVAGVGAVVVAARRRRASKLNAA